ncbi:hypothetical protein ORL23_04845 [Kluyvera cryocrescens]|uniref:hypothetical protein n=1 Tax=Kluyvera cryocrescens TaxID=580 RepID=UPI00224B7CFA|nr:hypothetical protein [Kluyvera cryocrescens]MCX2866819.1 hypothetical protein [Kluyvera cryocrescens]MEB7714062.1 hypothetical protein [Kluyvera cryocrescens]WNN72364.1 hypothetical protein RIN60_03040 [Kluyvera cryocrescens]
MRKRNKKQQHVVEVVKPTPSVDAPTAFGFEEMLSELEAIVAQAQDRLAEEAETV